MHEKLSNALLQKITLTYVCYFAASILEANYIFPDFFMQKFNAFFTLRYFTA